MKRQKDKDEARPQPRRLRFGSVLSYFFSPFFLVLSTTTEPIKSLSAIEEPKNSLSKIYSIEETHKTAGKREREREKKKKRDREREREREREEEEEVVVEERVSLILFFLLNQKTDLELSS